MEIFERFLKEVDLSQLNNDDTIDFLTIKNIHKMFKLGRRRVIDHVVGKAGNESLGMPLFVECIYRMQHHWSPRVYEVAFLISNHYLVGYLGRQTPILTDLTSELVQYNMQEPEEEEKALAVAEKEDPLVGFRIHCPELFSDSGQKSRRSAHR